METLVAFEAVTDSVDELPAEIDVGLAAMLTEGWLCVRVPLIPPQPTASKVRKKPEDLARSSQRKPLVGWATGKAVLLLKLYQHIDSAVTADSRDKSSAGA